MHKAAAVLFALSLLPQSWAGMGVAEAAMPENLTLPIDCEPGRDCWVVRYVDHDPGPGVKDYACGRMTGDGHKGTDFAIRDLATMSSGVSVRAAAAGRVSAVRDGMEDQFFDTAGGDSVGGRECGNGVRIDHGDGWFSLYCHMRRGSTLVIKGDEVRAGQSLGLVGLSGQTSFPHLHFDLRYHDQAIDPFVGAERTSDCGPDKGTLWSEEVLEAINYRPPLLVNSGITVSAPEEEDVRKGWHRAHELPSTSPTLTLWIDGYWFEQGDEVRFLLQGPNADVVIDRQLDVGRHRQNWFSFASAPRPVGGWPSGIYRGEVQVQRDGSAIKEAITSTVEIN